MDLLRHAKVMCNLWHGTLPSGKPTYVPKRRVDLPICFEAEYFGL